jgi:hypothetical protein
MVGRLGREDYALYGGLAGTARTRLYLAEMRRWVVPPAP